MYDPGPDGGWMILGSFDTQEQAIDRAKEEQRDQIDQGNEGGDEEEG
jgi:hypothetical protein